jgi:hypothetical protein
MQLILILTRQVVSCPAIWSPYINFVTYNLKKKKKHTRIQNLQLAFHHTVK